MRKDGKGAFSHDFSGKTANEKHKQKGSLLVMYINIVKGTYCQHYSSQNVKADSWLSLVR